MALLSLHVVLRAPCHPQSGFSRLWGPLTLIDAGVMRASPSTASARLSAFRVINLDLGTWGRLSFGRSTNMGAINVTQMAMKRLAIQVFFTRVIVRTLSFCCPPIQRIKVATVCYHVTSLPTYSRFSPQNHEFILGNLRLTSCSPMPFSLSTQTSLSQTHSGERRKRGKAEEG